MTKAKQAETVAETTTLLSRIEKLASRCESLIGKTEDDENWSAGWSAGCRRETGEDLAERPADLSSHAVMAIGQQPIDGTLYGATEEQGPLVR